jgi:membrane associated rhomboid family serine protease
VIPIRDLQPAHRFPIVNVTMIALCSIAFGAEVLAGENLDALIDRYALIPARFLTLGERTGYFQPHLYGPFVTSMFLHAGVAHYAFNMLFLWIFGDNVEDRMGHLRYLSFYLLGGIAAGAAHVAANASSVVPTIGASGAIAAVMGAYIVLYPHARIVSLVVFGFYVRTVAIPAFLYLGFWFALQLLQGTMDLGRMDSAGGVAWWAHAGGFAFGAAAIVVLGIRRTTSRT